MFENQVHTTKLVATTQIASSTWYGQKKDLKNAESLEDRRKNNKGRPRTKFSRDAQGNTISNEEIIEKIRVIRNSEFFENGGGYRKMSFYLKRRFEINVNHKKLAWLMRESDLMLASRKRKPREPCQIAYKMKTVVRPFKLWELDVKYGALITGQFFYVLAIIDVYLRYIVGWHIGMSCKGSDLERTLSLAINKFKITEEHELYIRSDNGPQMRSKVFLNIVKESPAKLVQEFIPCGEPNKNAHIESFNSILEVECFCVRIFDNFAQAYSKTNDFINFYHNERVHGSLGYKTPQECLNKVLRGEGLNLKPIRL